MLSPTTSDSELGGELAIIVLMTFRQQIIGSSNPLNSNSSFNGVVNSFSEVEAEGHQILRWLSPLERQQQRQGVWAGRQDSMGNWALETSEFRMWQDTKDSYAQPTLLFYGNTGVRESYIRRKYCLEKGDTDVANN